MIGKSRRHRIRAIRALILVSGLVLWQAILIGPSLIGQKVFLPLDLLQTPRVYLPFSQFNPQEFHGDQIRSDLVFQLEPNRLFAARQVRSGNLPLWDPYNYCGAPFLAANQPAVLSPFRLLDYAWPAPAALAWGQVLRAIIAGGGIYLFLRRAIGLRFIPALFGAWCYPLSGFLTQWAGYLQADEVTWFPFLLLATFAVIRGRRPARAMIGLSLATAAVLLSGHSATGLQMLFFSGLFALWKIYDRFKFNGLFGAASGKAVIRLMIAWIIGMGLSMPQTLPTLQYMRDSARIANRTKGVVEAPPVGLSAIAQMLLPYFFGETTPQHHYGLHSTVPPEGLPTAYVGLVLTLVVVPFGWLNRRSRRDLLFWAIIAVIGLAYLLDLPGLSAIFRLPGVDALRNNRLTFVTGFALIVWAAVGMDAIARRRVLSKHWLWLAVIPAVLAIVCITRAESFPDELQTFIDELKQNASRGIINPLKQPVLIAHLYVVQNYSDAVLCAIAIVVVGLIIFVRGRFIAQSIVGFICIAELLMVAHVLDRQGDVALYYPHLSVVDQINSRPPGRVCGAGCLPPALNLVFPLPDVRGYDSADPIEITQLLRRIQAPMIQEPPYAQTQWWAPNRESGVLDLLDLRYLIGYGPPRPFPGIVWADGSFFLIERPTANTRVFVPRQVEVIADSDARLDRLNEVQWEPRESLILESPPQQVGSPMSGSATIVRDDPEQVEIDANMDTPGYVLLGDRWDPGWHATVNGQPTEILRADHAFRAVAVPAGKSRIVYRYWPSTFVSGCWIAFASAMILLFIPLRSVMRALFARRLNRAGLEG